MLSALYLEPVLVSTVAEFTDLFNFPNYDADILS